MISLMVITFNKIYEPIVNKTNLNIKEDRVRGIYVQNLTEESV